MIDVLLWLIVGLLLLAIGLLWDIHNRQHWDLYDNPDRCRKDDDVEA